MIKLTEIMKLRNARDEAQGKLEDAMKEHYKPGLLTHYERGGKWMRCLVIRVAGDRVRVEGESNRRFWVSGYRMRGASVIAHQQVEGRNGD